MKNFKKSGFTLIEALVAISILMIAITSPMYLAQKSLSTSSLAKDQMIAGFLAQDGIEAVKNIRDQIAISQTTGDWLDGTLLNDCMCDSSNCNFDSPKITFCTIDSTVNTWTSGSQNSSIKGGIFTTAKLKETYNVSADGTKVFLKYDYNPTNLPSCTGFTGPGQCSQDSKFTRYINIQKDPKNTNKDEAVVTVRVTWDSPMGLQKTPDIQDFIYNYSENL